MKGMTRRLVIVLALATMLASIGTTAAVAAKGGGGGKGHHTNTGTSSLTLVLLNSTDGVPHWGQQVTFNVSTTATQYPYVSLQCFQASGLVYSTSAGFYDSYPWPWERNFTLSSTMWTGGAADCTATLYSADGGRQTVLATLGFHVYD